MEILIHELIKPFSTERLSRIVLEHGYNSDFHCRLSELCVFALKAFRCRRETKNQQSMNTLVLNQPELCFHLTLLFDYNDSKKKLSWNYRFVLWNEMKETVDHAV